MFYQPFFIILTMKKTTLLFLFISTISFGQITITPSSFDITDEITITVDTKINTGCNGLSNPTKVYMHSGVGDDSSGWGFSVVGNWGQDDGIGQMTSQGNGIFSITLTPSTYYGLTSTQQDNATQMGMVFRNASGNQEMKDSGCSDFYIPVGAFQMTLNSPSSSTSYLNAGQSVSISATTSLASNFVLKANNSTVNTQNNTKNYSHNYQVNQTTNFTLEATLNDEVKSESFTVIVSPTVSQQAIPSGMVEGINYHSNDDTKATLVLRAPNKDYIYVAGSFNNYTYDDNYVMKQDTNDTDLYWLEVTGLTAGTTYTFQYWVTDETPINNSPSLVKTADPYSTLVLSPYDDPTIPSSSYPNLPTYPSGQEREVSVIKTGEADYNWSVTNFPKPKKEDLVIYEVLIRDFDADRNYQDLIDRIDYFKNLNINAIQLMPVMEFEGNESWGYNPSFHFALDKFYGTSEKFKEFVDLCHQNGIAVILDIVLNHAMGRNPLVRMWMNDSDGDGWGDPSTENPYFNTTAKHSYNVGNDFDHSATVTQNYVKRFIKYWIEEYKVDGFRWDLTKGFTQNCSDGNDSCTNAYQQDRVDILKEYADYSWSIDPTHYVIFEHLGTDTEEQEWANYRINDSEPKGIMMWGKMTNEYATLLKGYSSSISRAQDSEHGFTKPRLIAYPESHDEERLMYEAIKNGNTSNSSHNIRNINIALKRMATIGAINLTLPGPKMVWHFGALGMDNSIFTCSDGSYSNDGCKLSTKPQPQWEENWLQNSNRKNIYDTWSQLIDFKINEDVFEGTLILTENNQEIRIQMFDLSLPSTSLSNVIILANLSTNSKNIDPTFASTGTWYNLMDNNSTINVTNVNTPITVPAGEFVMFGNKASTLSNESNIVSDNFKLYPNPTNDLFYINSEIKSLEIYDLLGKLIKVYDGNFESNYPFSVENINPGNYIVKASNHEGIIIKRIIKR